MNNAYQKMNDSETSSNVKAEPELPSDAIVLTPLPVVGQPIQPGASVGYPTVTSYAQPVAYVQPVPYAQPPPYAQQPVAFVQPQQSVAIQCVLCLQYVSGIYFRCIGCKNNGRRGGYHLCPGCHSRQRVREKGLFDELTQEMGQWQYNSTSERPHELYHPFEQVNALAAIPSGPVFMAQPIAPGKIQLFFSCRDLPRQGFFGSYLPDPSIAVSINGHEIGRTEQLNQCSNPNFQRGLEVSNAESKVSITVYSSSSRAGMASFQMSEILAAPGQSCSKALEDPKTGYRLTSGKVFVKWTGSAPIAVPQSYAQPMQFQVAQPYAQAPVQFGHAPQQYGSQYAQPPQYHAIPPA